MENLARRLRGVAYLLALLFVLQGPLSRIHWASPELIDVGEGRTVWKDPSLWDHFWDVIDPHGYAAVYRYSIIKSIQGVVCTSCASTNTQTLSTTLSSIANAVIHNNGFTTTQTANDTGYMGWDTVLTNTTTVTFNNGNSPTSTIRATVVEYYGAVLTTNGVQRGVITFGNADTSLTATITAVGSKAQVIQCGFLLTGSGAGATAAKAATNVVLTNSTTVTAAVNTASALDQATCWQVPDFK